MKYALALILVVATVMAGHAQKRHLKPPPKPPAPLPPPPKPVPPEDEKMEADPLVEHITAFWTDTLYRTTDSSFQVELWNFAPSGSGTARLSKNIYPYPRRYTKDSLIKDGNRVLSLTMETYFQDGEYVYNKKRPKEADKIIFTDTRTKRRTVFSINWEGDGADKTIKALKDEATNTLWKPGDPPAYGPTGF
ncbi:hypothetical protein [Niabella beijingensis]|uniref:hypothetical protein n=1 Tax=Niabella beijingensis TaxID=2872700 RepID=UPI001CC1A7E8|nr:hypothetical protein [Niabella beijingensis]MBZ4192678.1 hypothetical protein [Niabella beijingensis]